MLPPIVSLDLRIGSSFPVEEHRALRRSRPERLRFALPFPEAVSGPGPAAPPGEPPAPGPARGGGLLLRLLGRSPRHSWTPAPA